MEGKSEFRSLMLEVERKYDALMSAPTFKCADVPRQYNETPGIYLISENGIPLYVGRSNKIGQRLQGHRRRSHNTAAFAFLLARHETGRLRAAYQPQGGRADLLNDPVFAEAFHRAIERIRAMDVQIVEEADPVRQALLEIYAAYVSKAKYNDFDNH